MVSRRDFSPGPLPLGSAGTGAHGPIAEAAARPRASHWLAIAVALVSIGATTWLVTERRHHSEPAWRQLTVTAFPGSEEDPSLSPDGNFVAFAWKTESEPSLNADIWVKAVEGDALRRLTNTADAYEKHPAWSRDGRYIAFNRTVKGIHSVYLVSSLGGAERLIAGHSRDAVWLPDGQSLILVSTRSSLINGLPQSDSLRRPDRSTLHDFQRRNRPQYRLYSLEIAAETMATKSGHSAVQDIEKLR